MSGKRLHLRIPGSSANLGPGFDTLGLALNVYADLTFELLDKDDWSVPLITLQGKTAEKLPDDDRNLIYKTMANLWKDCPSLLKRLRLTIASQIPLAHGLGSSSTAILGSVWAAHALAERKCEPKAILEEACAIEGHPDNLAASLYGGLVIGSQVRKSVTVQRLYWPSKWIPLMVVPAYSLDTQKARAVLPKQVSMADAVHNVQKVASLIAAVKNEDDEALSGALQDRLHEPYRNALVPELSRLRHELKSSPALGCVLSGAGPSILVIVNEADKDVVLKQLQQWAAADNYGAEILDLHVDTQGLKEINAD